MLRYGIPNYRLPKERLDDDIQAILDTGVKVDCGKAIGKDYSIVDLKRKIRCCTDHDRCKHR